MILRLQYLRQSQEDDINNNKNNDMNIIYINYNNFNSDNKDINKNDINNEINNNNINDIDNDINISTSKGEWRRVEPYKPSGPWVLEDTAAVCRDLDCGSAVDGEERDDFPQSPVWRVSSDCVKKKSAVKDCVYGSDSSSSLGVEVVCSDLLNRPVISLSVSDGASQARPQGVRVLLGSKFRVKCSVEPQYPGGSFQLLSPTGPLGQNHTLPAVNHSAHFLFSDTGSAHKGNYTCVYHLHVFNHNFSSQSPSLQLSLGAPVSDLIIRVLVILLLKLLYILPMYYYYCKVRARGGR
ncbi:ABC transporter G family member 7-like [Periophthalmus magnuspinnatus]|uniref:ABC transporter G family member 7-like n=1 Tax=Periophthalmus magnuspinnatus TaxID=409849 RepID=UPI0024373EB4|nr:ABC transporter G family member 7-like [Periophthalmus magnuspinnatus]